MASLMLINPARRPSKRRRHTGHRKATPAQLRALAKARRARAGLATNPSPRKRRHHALRAVSHRARRRARRNPIVGRGIGSQLMDAGLGAVGALGVNMVTNFLPLPASMATGTMKEVTKMAVALALGMATRRALGRKAGVMVEGALTVSAYNILAGYVPASMGGGVPAGATVPASSGTAGLGFMNPGMIAGPAPGMWNQSMQGMGEYVSGMGEYVSGYGY